MCWALPHLQTFHLIRSPSSGSPGGSPSRFSNFRWEVRPPSFQTFVGRARLLPSQKLISHLILGSPGGSPSRFLNFRWEGEAPAEPKINFAPHFRLTRRFALPIFKLPLGGRGSCRATKLISHLILGSPGGSPSQSLPKHANGYRFCQ